MVTVNTFDLIGIIVNSFAILDLFLLSALLFFRKNNVYPNYLLGGIIFLPVFNFTFNLLTLTGVAIKYPEIILFSTSPLNTLFPLLIYLYTRSMTGKKIFTSVYYFIPWFILLCIDIYFQISFLQLPSEAQHQFIRGLLIGMPPKLFLKLNVAFFLVTIIYTFKSYRLAIANNKQYSNGEAVSNTELKSKSFYLLRLVRLSFAMAVIIVVAYFFIPYKWIEFIVLPIVMSVVFFLIIYSAQKSSSLFSELDFTTFFEEKKIENLLKKPNQTKNELSFPDEEVYLKVENFIKNKGYLDATLTLPDLARQLDVKTYQLSTVIKNKYHSNFNDFINSYRIEYAIEMLKDNYSENLSIEGVGLSAGFNTRMSFYRNFKKFTGLTPTQFIAKKCNK